MGTQTKSYKGEDREVHTVYLCWELTDCPMTGTKGVNHLIGKEFTFSLNVKSGLRQMIVSWRGGKDFAEDDDFDLHKLFGKPCLVNVGNTDNGEGRTFSNFKGCTPLPKGMAVKKPQRGNLFWEIEAGALEELSWLPYSYGNKISDLVQTTPEWKARRHGGNGQAEDESETAAVGDSSEIPF